ncbi:MAG: LemA family protein [Desulfamplus sp.]|nr:LemA family protein [Desulfamplus sp.]
MATRSTVSRIIRNAYGRKYNLEAYEYDMASKTWHESSINYYIAKLYPLMDFFRNKWIHLTTVLLTLVIAIGTIYYYNTIMSYYQDAVTGESKVQALMQRRNDISINLAKAVFDYSRYERDVMTGIVALRTLVSDETQKAKVLQKLAAGPDMGTGSREAVTVTSGTDGQNPVTASSKTDGQDPATAGSGDPGYGAAPTKDFNPADAFRPLSALATGGAALSSLGSINPLGELMAVAEQYPDLKLSANFNSLMTALIDVEKDLATERLKYNDQVNIYTTTTAMFPGNLFAYLFGFPDMPYFTSTDDAKTLVPISY